MMLSLMRDNIIILLMLYNIIYICYIYITKKNLL